MNSLLEKKYEEKLKNEHNLPEAERFKRPEITLIDAQDMIAFADHDEDGVLDFTEFAKILMNKGKKKI